MARIPHRLIAEIAWGMCYLDMSSMTGREKWIVDQLVESGWLRIEEHHRVYKTVETQKLMDALEKYR